MGFQSKRLSRHIDLRRQGRPSPGIELQLFGAVAGDKPGQQARCLTANGQSGLVGGPQRRQAAKGQHQDRQGQL